MFIEKITEINSVLNDFIWGVPGLVLLIGTGILMTFCTKFFQVTHIGHWFRETIGSLFKKNSSSTKKTDRQSISQFQALCTALAATVGTGNIAGVTIPTFEGADFARGDYDLYEAPLWIDIAAHHMERAMLLDLEAEVLEEQVRLLEAELRSTAQRVNLFEKVKIPETKENIKKISIYMADQQVNAVVRSKISKRKIDARGAVASEMEVYTL